MSANGTKLASTTTNAILNGNSKKEFYVKWNGDFLFANVKNNYISKDVEGHAVAYGIGSL